MSKPLRVLIIDDSENDALLLTRFLHKSGYALQSQRIETAPELKDALQQPWDLILCDYSMPNLDAPTALELVKRTGLDIPFIVVSGAVGEEVAAEMMRRGAHDIVLKDRLARLGPAIERELQEAARRAEQRKTQKQLAQAQETLKQAERLRALGQMAAGIAHDLKNLLNPISLHVQLLGRELAETKSVEGAASIEAIKKIIARGVEIIDRLREFSRQDAKPDIEPIKLDWIAREAIEICKPQLANKTTRMAEFRTELEETPTVMANKADLISAVVNLIVNAFEAMKEKGTVTVKTGSDQAGCFLCVQDTGPGISNEVRERIFEPFFTTKGDQGTGLGLAMVYATAARYQGTASVETELNRGTTFTLRFPSQR